MTVQEFRVPTGEPLGPPLPQNLDAERSVLGAILLSNPALAIAAKNLRSSDFYLAQNALIFSEMLAMQDAGIPIDQVLLPDELHKMGKLEAAGGTAYINSLIDGVPKVTHIEHYCEIVREKSRLRQLFHVLDAGQKAVLEDAEGADVILERLSPRVTELRAAAATAWQGTFHKISELAAGKPEAIIEGYVEEGLSFFGAKSGVGKTWLGISEGQALRTGEPLLGVFSIPQKRNVLYLIPEMTERRFRSRCEALGVDINDPGFLVRTMNDGAPLPLNNRLLWNCIEKLLPVTYLDTAIRFGDGEENSAGEVSRGLISATYQLIKLGCPAVRALHHRAKDASDDELTLENVLRGSGDFGAGAVCVWGAAHETALRAGNFEELDLLGRKKPSGPARQKLEHEYLRESRRLGRCYLECVKPGDREILLWDFRIQLRPSIDQNGKIEMLTADPTDKGPLIDELLAHHPDASTRKLGELLGVHKNTAVARAQARGWTRNEQSGIWSRP